MNGKSASYYKNEKLVLALVSGCVLLTGSLAVLGVLFAQTHIRSASLLKFDSRITLLVGLTLIYLSVFLRRGKHTAWLIAFPLYVIIVLHNVREFIEALMPNVRNPELIALNLVVPVLALYGLIFGRKYFRVRSEVSNFSGAFARATLVLLVAFLYGLIGFQLLDTHDFHQEISVMSGAHYTVDQFNLTTNKQLNPYTRRAKLFLDSLATISLGSLFYVAFSIFSPIRFRLSDQRHNRDLLEKLLKKYPASSEDYFKLWPHDKAYFFSRNNDAALAFKVKAGVALCVGDPVGKSSEFAGMLTDYNEFCYVNDWMPAFIHTDQKNAKLYKKFGFDMQKIGEEAVVDIGHFKQTVAGNKYFRNIKNRFERQEYTTAIFSPPHNRAMVLQLRKISNEWLQAPGRAERTFMMGYFNEHYLQQCQILAAIDSNGQIQAYLNQIKSFDESEANFDFLRSAKDAPSNINDYLMMNFIDLLAEQGFTSLNMGLSPLAGLKKTDSADDDIGVLDNALQVVYSAGGRFYSFAGLKRFKEKYEPNWQSRYVVYRGGVPGFGRVMNALVRAMKV